MRRVKRSGRHGRYIIIIMNDPCFIIISPTMVMMMMTGKERKSGAMITSKSAI